MLGDVNKLFSFQNFIDNAQQCFAFTPQANFPTHNLNFHWRWRWWDQIQAIFLNIFYFTIKSSKNFEYFFKDQEWIEEKQIDPNLLTAVIYIRQKSCIFCNQQFVNIWLNSSGAFLETSKSFTISRKGGENLNLMCASF